MIDMVKAIIVDDEQDARASLKRILSNLSINIELIGEAKNAQTALEIIIDKQPELVFLDIEMPVNDGFWLADKLRKIQIPLSIIFVTAFNQYAVQAIRFAAFDYITKPIDVDLLEQAMQRYLVEHKQNNFQIKAERLRQFLDQKRINLTTQNGYILLIHNTIIYCKAKGNYTTVYIADGRIETVHIQLGLLEEELSNPIFVRISRSKLINTEYLQSINRRAKTVLLTDILQQYEVKMSFSGRKKLSALNLC